MSVAINGVVRVQTTQAAPDQKDAKQAPEMTPENAAKLFQSIADKVIGLTQRTRKDFVYIARYTRKWGKWKLSDSMAKNAECIAALKTEYDLKGIKLDVSLIRKSFAVLPDWRRAEKQEKTKEFFSCATQAEVDALLGKKVESSKAPAKTGIAGSIARFQKTLAACVKKNDVEALRVFSKIASDALAIVEGKRKPKKQKVQNGAVVTETPAPVTPIEQPKTETAPVMA